MKPESTEEEKKAFQRRAVAAKVAEVAPSAESEDGLSAENRKAFDEFDAEIQKFLRDWWEGSAVRAKIKADGLDGYDADLHIIFTAYDRVHQLGRNPIDVGRITGDTSMGCSHEALGRACDALGDSRKSDREIGRDLEAEMPEGSHDRDFWERRFHMRVSYRGVSDAREEAVESIRGSYDRTYGRDYVDPFPGDDYSYGTSWGGRDDSGPEL